MKNKLSFGALLVMVSVMLTSCEVIGDIFQAGIAFGVIIVVVVIILVLWLIRKIMR